jgi:hypothetical protein
MDRTGVTSSMIESIGYEPETGIVEVEFKPNLQIWQYFDVPESVFLEVLNAPSIGKAFTSQIKKAYRAIRVG